MTNAYAEWLNEIRQEYGEQLSEMPLPKGLPEHVQELIRNRDEDTILFMLRLAWQLGAQAGFSAGAAKRAAASKPEFFFCGALFLRCSAGLRPRPFQATIQKLWTPKLSL